MQRGVVKSTDSSPTVSVVSLALLLASCGAPGQTWDLNPVEARTVSKSRSLARTHSENLLRLATYRKYCLLSQAFVFKPKAEDQTDRFQNPKVTLESTSHSCNFPERVHVRRLARSELCRSTSDASSSRWSLDLTLLRFVPFMSSRRTSFWKS